jgi:hypothetical protein
MYCLHHAQGNIVQHARWLLQSSFGPFMQDFWAAYWGVSPEEFDCLWNHLTLMYPPMKDYLDRELYPCCKQWAWAWISTTFTAGVQTTGQVESENWITQASLGAKSSPKQLYNVLNERVVQQKTLDLQCIWDVCNFLRFIPFIIHSLPQSLWKQHDCPIESIFPGPLTLLHEHVGPFTLHKCYEQMELSNSYKTKVVHRPEGIHYWVTFPHFWYQTLATHKGISRVNMPSRLVLNMDFSGNLARNRQVSQLQLCFQSLNFYVACH